MEHEVLGKLRSAIRKAGNDALVAFSQDNVTYTAGFLVPSHASNRFRRTITILAGDSFAAQIVVNVEENLARQRSRFSDIRSYNQFTQDPADLLADTLIEAGVGSGRIAIELDFMPAQDYIRLRERLPNATFVPCRDLYFDTRMIKTAGEIAILKEVGALTDGFRVPTEELTGKMEGGRRLLSQFVRAKNASVTARASSVASHSAAHARSPASTIRASGCRASTIPADIRCFSWHLRHSPGRARPCA